eukprot:scaffold5006_cov116-Isochrysis_galbana.AAC.5
MPSPANARGAWLRTTSRRPIGPAHQKFLKTGNVPHQVSHNPPASSVRDISESQSECVAYAALLVVVRFAIFAVIFAMEFLGQTLFLGFLKSQQTLPRHLDQV